MKKILSLILAIGFIAMCLSGCGNRDNSDNSDTVDYISLNTSNCNYYLSIDDNITKSDNGYAGGTKWVSIYRKITISGAVNGIYSECCLTIEYGENKTQKDITLNASGFATFEYHINNSSYTAKVVSCTGKIYL